jgi:hypothetical protein
LRLQTTDSAEEETKTPLTDTSEDLSEVSLLDGPTRPAIKEKLIDALSNGYDWFLAEQRQRHARRHPKFDFNDEKVRIFWGLYRVLYVV